MKAHSPDRVYVPMLSGYQEIILPAGCADIGGYNDKRYRQREEVILVKISTWCDTTDRNAGTYQRYSPHQHIQSAKLYSSDFLELILCEVVERRVLPDDCGEREIRNNPDSFMGTL